MLLVSWNQIHDDRKFTSYHKKESPHRQLINNWMKKSRTLGLVYVYSKPGSGRCQQGRDCGPNWNGVGKESKKHALHICWIKYSRSHRLRNSNSDTPKHVCMFRRYKITMPSSLLSTNEEKIEKFQLYSWQNDLFWWSTFLLMWQYCLSHVSCLFGV